MASKKIKGAKGTPPDAVPAKKELSPHLLKVVERMNRMLDDRDGKMETEAISCGETWAEEHAAPWELERLSERRRELDDTPDQGLAKLFVSIVAGSAETDWEETREFFEKHVGAGRVEEWETRNFIDFFGAGALGVWSQVKPLLSRAA